MKEDLNIEETLWNYIDGQLQGDRRSFVEDLVRKDNEWKTKHAELVEIHHLMQNSIELDQPSMRFTQNVMEEISRLYITPATRNYINKNVVRGIALFFLISIVGLIIYGFGQVQWGESDPGLVSAMDFSKIDYSRFFNNTYMSIFMMINVMLALMLADMYLTKRKTDHMHVKS